MTTQNVSCCIPFGAQYKKVCSLHCNYIRSYLQTVATMYDKDYIALLLFITHTNFPNHAPLTRETCGATQLGWYPSHLLFNEMNSSSQFLNLLSQNKMRIL